MGCHLGEEVGGGHGDRGAVGAGCALTCSGLLPVPGVEELPSVGKTF